MKDFSRLEKKIGINFNDKNLLTQAFVHRSYINENTGFEINHNERLEFLGDAVLELIVTEELYKDHPERSEGELTHWRAALVNSKMLSLTSQNIGLNDFLLLSKGENRENGKARQYILANTFESLLGAMYLDQGYEICKDFIKRYLLKELTEIVKKGLFKDAKSLFQETAQEKTGLTPNYKVLEEWGPDHAKHFIVGVHLGDELIAQAEGLSKQEAEEMAAQEGLEAKGW